MLSLHLGGERTLWYGHSSRVRSGVRLREDCVTRKHSGADLTPILLRVSEVAILIGLSERQVWSLIRTGQLRAIHPPGIRVIRIARLEVEALVTQWLGEGQQP